MNPADPYPHLPGLPDVQAMAHAAEVDAWLGFELEATERRIEARVGRSRLGDSQEFWVGLNVQSMNTPYIEIRGLLERLEPAPGSRVVDLGAAYGRMAFVIGHCFPQVEFVGYEMVPERVAEANRCLARFAYSNVRVEERDLSAADFAPVPADFYFLYDYGTRAAVEKTLQDLQRVARERHITVVGRGRLSRDAIERHHPWLSQVIAPEHGRNHSIYRSG